ncbi:MAG: MFS transporter [Mogibacterium sp.]|nr:MFS transporter [Mogibacterium sp.]
MLEQYKGLRKELYILAFGRLVTGLGSMVWPMMTLILSQKMNVGATEISWLLSAAMIIMAPAIYAGGKIADVRNKKMTIVVLDLVSVVCYGICAFIPMSWGTIFLIFIGSLCQNMENPAYNALTADISITADRDRAYSLQYLCANLGLVLSPTLAGLLFKNFLWVAFLINSMSILSSAILIFFRVKDIRPVAENTESSVYQKERRGESIRRILGDNKVVLMFIAVMSGYYAVYHMYVYLMPLDLAVLHGDSGAVIYGSVTSINCIVVVLFTPIITKLYGNRPEPERALAGITLMVAGFIMFYIFIGSIPVYYISMTILTWGEIFAMTSESAYISRRVPSSHRGQINGAFTVIRTLLGSAFQLIIGAVYGSSGSSAAWIAVFAAGAFFILIAALMRSQDKKEYPNLY